MLAEALILSGLAMSVAGSSRPCSGGDHEIMHAIDQLYPGTASHGELAGVGAVFCAYLRGDDGPGRASSPRACAGTACPHSPADLGLSHADFAKAVALAPEHPARPLHHPGAPRPVRGRHRRPSGGLCPGHRWLSSGRRASRQAVIDRLNDEHWAGRLYMRKVSPAATWVFARLGWSPNAVTGRVHRLRHRGRASSSRSAAWPARSAAPPLIQAYLLFDCSDGELARWSKRTSADRHLPRRGRPLPGRVGPAGRAWASGPQGHLTGSGGVHQRRAGRRAGCHAGQGRDRQRGRGPGQGRPARRPRRRGAGPARRRPGAGPPPGQRAAACTGSPRPSSCPLLILARRHRRPAARRPAGDPGPAAGLPGRQRAHGRRAPGRHRRLAAAVGEALLRHPHHGQPARRAGPARHRQHRRGPARRRGPGHRGGQRGRRAARARRA